MTADGDDSEIVLSDRQQQLWMGDQVSNNPAGYLVPMALQLRGSLDVQALQRAFAEVIASCDLLRMSVRVVGGEPRGVLRPAVAFKLDVLEGVALDEKLAELSASEATTPIDVSTEFPIRAQLVTTGPDAHVLLITAHHMAVDYRSQQLLYDDLARAYNDALDLTTSRQACRPEYADLPAVPASVIEEQLNYWATALDGLSPFEVPTDFTRPPTRLGRGATVRRLISPPAAASLHRTAARAGVSSATVLFAAAAIVMRHLSGRDDITFGTTVSLRSQTLYDQVIGPLFNMVVLRWDTSNNPTFTGLVSRLSEVALDAYEHADAPFDAVVARSGTARDGSRTPLFQIMVGYGRDALRPPALHGLAVSVGNTQFSGSKFDLNMWFEDLDDGAVALTVYYDTDLYAAATAQRVASAVTEVATACGADPDARILDLSQSGAIGGLTDFASLGPVICYGPPRCLHDAFREQAARTPEAAAISTAYGSTISYQSLDERSDRLTDHLTRLGVGDGSIVAVLLEKGAEALVTFIGIMKASAAYLPLDTTHPAARLSFMVADSSATVLVTVPEFAHLIPEDYAGTVLDIRHLSNGVKAPSGTPRSGQSLDTLAYVIYTSGSTGTPKGVMVTHGGLMNYLEWAGTVYGQHPGTGSLLVGSVAYDMTVPSLFLPLLNGRAVLVPPEPASFDAVADLVRLDEGGIGILKCAPGYLDVLAGFLGQAHVDSVRTYVVGGDALRGDTVRRWRKCAPSARIVNEYGPTETVVGCCIYNVPEVLDHGTPDGAMPIGHAIANTQVYVLDNNLKPVVRGGVGELFIGGVGVARGYLNRPGLTAERFLPDPYGRAGGRLYRTGDLGRVGPEGDLLFLGRADRQVKISGYRVEIEEVESALSSDPAVGECIAVVRHADAGDSLLVGYVTPSSPGQALDAGSVLAEARRSLPAYAVPSRLVSLPELPHMPNGKVDRAALPEFDQLSERQDDRAHGPEADVRAAWSEVLGSANFGAHDHFFDVGGSSLRLMRVINRLSDRYDIDLPMGAMFARPTVADMSARLAEICAGAKHTLANDKMHPA